MSTHHQVEECAIRRTIGLLRYLKQRVRLLTNCINRHAHVTEEEVERALRAEDYYQWLMSDEYSLWRWGQERTAEEEAIALDAAVAVAEAQAKQWKCIQDRLDEQESWNRPPSQECPEI